MGSWNMEHVHKCKVEWVEKQDNIFAFVVRETDLLELLADKSLGRESWSGLAFIVNTQKGEIDGVELVKVQTNEIPMAGTTVYSSL